MSNGLWPEHDAVSGCRGNPRALASIFCGRSRAASAYGATRKFQEDPTGVITPVSTITSTATTAPAWVRSHQTDGPASSRGWMDLFATTTAEQVRELGPGPPSWKWSVAEGGR